MVALLKIGNHKLSHQGLSQSDKYAISGPGEKLIQGELYAAGTVKWLLGSGLQQQVGTYSGSLYASVNLLCLMIKLVLCEARSITSTHAVIQPTEDIIELLLEYNALIPYYRLHQDSVHISTNCNFRSYICLTHLLACGESACLVGSNFPHSPPISITSYLVPSMLLLGSTHVFFFWLS